MTACFICNAPGILQVFAIEGLLSSHDVHAHGACWAAWSTGNREALATNRKRACDDGYHRYPGQWSRDPSDPYGDAAYWDCKWGCGYRQSHPGYGINRGIAEAKAAHPEVFAGVAV